MSEAIRDLKRKKREEERKKLMQKYYAPPITPPYAPPRLSKGSSNPIKMVGGIPIATGLEAIKVKLEVAIEDELAAIRDYTELANELDEFKLEKERYEISNIQLDEFEHRKKLHDILERLKRK